MPRGIPSVLTYFVLWSLLPSALLSGQTAANVPTEKSSSVASSQVRSTSGKLPLYFVENRGVYPDEVKYYIKGSDKTLFFTKKGVTFALKGKTRGWTVKLDFVGANQHAQLEGRAKQEAVFSYFTGPEKEWKTGLPTFAEVVYSDLWPGIDLVYRGTVNKLKYEFHLRPGADPRQIRLRYHGATDVRITERGALLVETPEGGFEDAPPFAHQDIAGERVPVEMAYALDEDGGIGFRVGEYDLTKPLVLDPAVLVYCGYIGGESDDRGHVIDIDAAGNAYVAGTTSSKVTFPVRVGPALTFKGGSDAFVAKVNAAGTALVYCGYIGGANAETVNGIAVDAAGNAYVIGNTTSDEKTHPRFPVTVGPDLTFNGSTAYRDAFVAKVNAAGTKLVYCGYVGGPLGDRGGGIAVDANGNAYLTGGTWNTESSFPVTVGPDLTHNGFQDVWVAKLKALPNAPNPRNNFVYCGYIGGADLGVGESGSDIAVDPAGNAYVAGHTGSNEKTFPVKVGPNLTYKSGTFDAFVAKVNTQGTALVYCGYIGGSGAGDYATGVALDAAGNLYVAGSTNSKDLPVTVGPDLTYNGGNDAFVAKVVANGSALAYCGYIGGARFDHANDVAIDAAGNAYVAGLTGSDENTFPAKVGPDLTHNGGNDGFVAKVVADGSALAYCGYIGGAKHDRCEGVTTDASGSAYVVGFTESAESSFPVTVGPDLTFNAAGPGLKDAFVAKVSLASLQGSGAPRPGATVQLALMATGDGGLPYQLGSSFGAGPLFLGKRALGLSVDNLLLVSVSGVLPGIFVGYQGLLDRQGTALAAIRIPSLTALVGQKIHTAFVTISPSAPLGIKSISNTFSFSITK